MCRKTCPNRDSCDQAERCEICETTLCGKAQPDDKCEFEGAFRITSGSFCVSCWETHTPLLDSKYNPPLEKTAA